MTVMLGMEALPDWNAAVRLPSNFQHLYAANASMAGFLPGEEVRVADLFYGALLPSGRTPAWTSPPPSAARSRPLWSG